MLESDIHLISFLILLSNLLIMLQQTEIFPSGKNVDIFKDFLTEQLLNRVQISW